MSAEFSISPVTSVKSGYVLDRHFTVKHLPSDRNVFTVMAYSGSCCGISTIMGVDSYCQEDGLAGALKFLADLPSGKLMELRLSWPLKSFFYYGSEQSEYVRISEALGMKPVFKFPSRSEPGHDVVQYFVDFGKSVPADEGE